MELPRMSTNYFPPEFPIRYIPTLIRYASPDSLEKPLGSKNSEHQIPTFGGERHKKLQQTDFYSKLFFPGYDQVKEDVLTIPKMYNLCGQP